MEEDEYNADLDNTPMKRNRRAMHVYVKIKDTTPYGHDPLPKQETTQLKWLQMTKRTGKTIRKNFYIEFNPVSKKIKYTCYNCHRQRGSCPCGCNQNQYSIYEYRQNFNRYFVKPRIDGDL
jgi:hypothetical protein